MKTIQVKICGIRSVESAQAAIHAGADFLGFNFVPTSKRYINPVIAQGIIKKIKGNSVLVGVFQDEEIEEVNKIIDFLHLDYLQLHGKETPEYVEKIKSKVIKSFTPSTIHNLSAYDVTYALIDREIQGQGEMVPEELFKTTFSCPVFISGGLTAENIGKILKNIHPCGVDVAGGIETNGVEDTEKIKEFVRVVKGGIL